MGEEQSGFPLLERIAASGWGQDVAEEFERLFGDSIRRALVVQLWRMGLVESRFRPERAAAVLAQRKLELFEATLTDLWLELLKGLVVRFVRGRKEDRIRQEFLGYLTGTIRHLLIKNAQTLGLLPRESAGEVLRALCSAKGEATRQEHIARLKFRFWPQVEADILSSCPTALFDEVYHDVYHVVDYFFEVHVPRNCAMVVKNGRRDVLFRLLESFGESDMRDGQRFVGKVVPYPLEARETSLGERESALLEMMVS